MKLPIQGGCQCGALRFEITEPPATLYCCHCSECRQQSASAFGMSLRVPNSAFHLTGEHVTYVRDAGEQTEVHGHFCRRCGVRVAHGGGEGQNPVAVKAGLLDDASQFEPVGHIWTRSALPWVQFAEGTLVYEGQPTDDDTALNEAFADRYHQTSAGD